MASFYDEPTRSHQPLPLAVRQRNQTPIARGGRTAQYHRSRTSHKENLTSWLLGCSGTDCCVARRKESKTSMLLTYAFTGTPAEIQIHRALKRWAGTPNCAGASSPDYAVLFMTEVNHKAFQRLAKHSAELRIRHPRTTFILVTPPHTQCDDRTIRKSEKLCKRGENRSALEAYDAAAVEAATPFDGVVALPIGEATARGLSDGVLRHEVTNPYHFHDAGRLFVLEMLLNAFAIAA